MRVKVISYPHVGLGKGGMYIQIKNTIESLRVNNVEIKEQNFLDNEVDADIVHVFGSHSSSFRFVQHCVKNNIPVIVSTVFNRFDVSPIRRLIDKCFMNIPGFLSELSAVKKMLKMAKLVIALNQEEKDLLIYYFDLDENKIKVIPNGIDDCYKKQLNKCHDVKENIVLNVASITPVKNQLNLIKASINKPWELRLVGPIGEEGYYKQCLLASKNSNNIIFVGSLPYNSDAMFKEYSKAKTFCLPSFSEVQPLSIIEAASYNCNLVISNKFPINKELKSIANFVNPNNIQEISEGIEKSFLLNSQSSLALKNLSSWDEVAKEIIEVYESIM